MSLLQCIWKLIGFTEADMNKQVKHVGLKFIFNLVKEMARKNFCVPFLWVQNCDWHSKHYVCFYCAKIVLVRSKKHIILLVLFSILVGLLLDKLWALINIFY